MVADVTVHRRGGRHSLESAPTVLHAHARARGFLDQPDAELVIVREAGAEVARWVRKGPTEWTFAGVLR